jgi:hypothetical protein
MVRKNPFIVGGPRLVVLVVLFVVVVAGGAILGATLQRGSPARLAIAVVQGLCVTAYVGGLFFSIRQLDELEQRIQYESIAHAFAATIILVTAYGYLERAGLPRVEWSLWVYPLMFLFWGLAWAVVVRRYR